MKTKTNAMSVEQAARQERGSLMVWVNISIDTAGWHMGQSLDARARVCVCVCILQIAMLEPFLMSTLCVSFR